MMYPETEEQRLVREEKLRVACEALGLRVFGSRVVAVVGCKSVSVDASAIDMDNLVPCLMYMAMKLGEERGKQDVLHGLKAYLEDI